jgi:predicted translin family RNA/ssDNA-binding protein
VSPDLAGLNTHRYARQISGGCQEWMEAASFEHYLTTASLLSFDAAAAQLRALDAAGAGIALSFEDYLLGIYDMTGELMRFAITAMATTGALPRIHDDDDDGDDAAQRSVLHDMRELRSALEALNTPGYPLSKEVSKKMEVMQTSVEKVERSL